MKRILYTICGLLVSVLQVSAAVVTADDSVKDIRQINASAVEVLYRDGHRLTIDFYSDNIFRLFQDNHGGIVRDPAADPPAKILVDRPRKPVGTLSLTRNERSLTVSSPCVCIDFDRKSALFRITDLRNGRTVVSQASPVQFKRNRYTMAFCEQKDEYFYGGGVQNGRFSHKGQQVEIVNTNSWTDGGVASPAPFYWSTGGYALMGYTFAPGRYDFGATQKGVVGISHDSPYLDIFIFVDNDPASLLADYYQLTGRPVLLPKFAFYEGHLNAYNRDFWKTSDNPAKGILMEDGKRYVESQKDNGGIRESLNGERDNYQFSARAVIDRYHKHDMPLGWLLPNDGYGAGYGQTETLDGNIENLKNLGRYAVSTGWKSVFGPNRSCIP